jgi:uncharacterized damage-inducible protein DinB
VERFYADYFERLKRLHEDAISTLDGLDDDSLVGEPGQDMNSLSVLAVHIAGAERFWIGDVAMSESSNRNREGEFQISGLSLEELIERLGASLDYIQRSLESLTLSDLEKPRLTPENRKVSIGWCLAHALAHTAIHVGHMQLTRQLLEK